MKCLNYECNPSATLFLLNYLHVANKKCRKIENLFFQMKNNITFQNIFIHVVGAFGKFFCNLSIKKAFSELN